MHPPAFKSNPGPDNMHLVSCYIPRNAFWPCTSFINMPAAFLSIPKLSDLYACRCWNCSIFRHNCFYYCHVGIPISTLGHQLQIFIENHQLSVGTLGRVISRTNRSLVDYLPFGKGHVIYFIQ